MCVCMYVCYPCSAKENIGERWVGREGRRGELRIRRSGRIDACSFVCLFVAAGDVA